MSIYTDAQLQHMREEFHSLREKYENLLLAMVRFEFTSDRSKEFAHHGFLRRLKVLKFAIDTVFERLPPDSTDLPEDGQIEMAMMALHAFYTNVFGCFDNLARVIVIERQITRPNGEELDRHEIGMRRNNRRVRECVSDGLREQLEETDPWFDHLEEFRHPLAHRIPLYIAPHYVTNENVERYQHLERERMDALFAENLEDYEMLSEEQNQLKRFAPLMGHSFHEESPQVYFHAQIIADYLTVHKFGELALEEIGNARDQ